jgi:hypothetical protein
MAFQVESWVWSYFSGTHQDILSIYSSNIVERRQLTLSSCRFVNSVASLVRTNGNNSHITEIIAISSHCILVVLPLSQLCKKVK